LSFEDEMGALLYMGDSSASDSDDGSDRHGGGTEGTGQPLAPAPVPPPPPEDSAAEPELSLPVRKSLAELGAGE
jgi:hypothetical protein